MTQKFMSINQGSNNGCFAFKSQPNLNTILDSSLIILYFIKIFKIRIKNISIIVINHDIFISVVHSQWNTNKISNMENIFFGCSSLASFPDISKWQINEATDMNLQKKNYKL